MAKQEEFERFVGRSAILTLLCWGQTAVCQSAQKEKVARKEGLNPSNTRSFGAFGFLSCEAT